MRYRFAVAILVLIVAAPGCESQHKIWRTVVRVTEGDAIVLDGLQRVRLIGVDTPKKGDPLEPIATNFTKKLALGRRVRVELDCNETDIYEGTFAYVYLEDGTMLNIEIIRQGMG
jgi:micrococcal nuclease